jgi:ATP-dependent DNA ligase
MHASLSCSGRAILDGEGVICGPDGVSDFDRMRGMFSRKGAIADMILAIRLGWLAR